MNLEVMYLLTSISVVLAVLPSSIDPRYTEIKTMKIQVEAELNKTQFNNKWTSSVFDITPEFVATANATCLIIKKDAISTVLVDMQQAARAHIEIAAVAMKKDADFVRDNLMMVEYFVVVKSYSNRKTFHTVEGITFERLSLPIHFCYSYFEFEVIKLNDGELLNFHHMTEDDKDLTSITIVLKNGKSQAQVARNPLLYKKITLKNDPSIEINGKYKLTGPYYWCVVVRVKSSTIKIG